MASSNSSVFPEPVGLDTTTLLSGSCVTVVQHATMDSSRAGMGGVQPARSPL
jgi:hypothetical protein